ncbi:hypothetical protein YERSI8AC_10004 [Enterobacterales bacterium 8AC]|nr:hypothetical protein YERSI8AC_10004 [Enterobacterales bacterium 8AC]
MYRYTAAPDTLIVSIVVFSWYAFRAYRQFRVAGNVQVLIEALASIRDTHWIYIRRVYLNLNLHNVNLSIL